MSTNVLFSLYYFPTHTTLLSPAVPCTPEITGVLLDCYTDSVLLEWAYAEGAVSYIATAQSGDKQTATCNTNHTNCELMELACGQTYTVTLRASDGQCDSFQSTSVKVSSGELTILDTTTTIV